MQFFKTSSLVGLGQDYVEWTLRGEFSHCRVQITFNGDTGAALGCQVVQDTGTPGSAKILSAASSPGAGAARELFAGLEDIIQDGVGSFRFRFPGTGCLAFRFVGAYGSVRFAKMIGSFRFVSHLFNILSVSFRFVSVSQTVCDFSEFA